MNNSAAQKLYKRYEFMANSYARKVFNHEQFGVERQDIVQELKLRIFYSIKKYGVEWYLYRNNNGIKPVPLQFYLQTVLNNKLKDLYFKFGRDLSTKNRVSIERNDFDYGVDSKEMTSIDFTKKQCIVRGVDLLSGLKGVQRDCFCLFLKGFDLTKIKKTFKHKCDVDSIIKNQVNYIKGFESELLQDNNQSEYYSFSTVQE